MKLVSDVVELAVDEGGSRLDRYIAEHSELSRSHVQKLIEEGNVFVDDMLAKASKKLKAGERIIVRVPPPLPTTLAPENIPLNIIYEDGDVMVIDKPAGLTVHPGAGHRSGTLVNAVLAHCPDIKVKDSTRPGIVHRLDKDTSGLIMVAKNDQAHITLAGQIKSQSFTKSYLALVHGCLVPGEGRIEAPIGRHPKDRKRMAVVSGGREAITSYQVKEYLGDYTLLEVYPKTGRTHQIRVHLSSIGHSVVGDRIYGKSSNLIDRHFLHAHRLGFELPSTKDYVEFESELPPELEQALQMIREHDGEAANRRIAISTTRLPMR